MFRTAIVVTVLALVTVTRSYDVRSPEANESISGSEQSRTSATSMFDADFASTDAGFPMPWSTGLTPTRLEQLAAFGRNPTTFRRGPIDSTWRYDDVLGQASDVSQFSPSRWPRTAIDPTTRFEDAYGLENDVTRFNPADWCRPPIRKWWYPTNGWWRGAVTANDE